MPNAINNLPNRSASLCQQCQALCGFLAIAALAVVADLSIMAAADGQEKPKNANVVELNFRGPFANRQRIAKYPAVNAWVEVQHLSLDFGKLSVYFMFRGEQDPRRQIRLTITATTRDGKTYKLIDGMCSDSRLQKPEVGGSPLIRFSPVNSVNVRLPASPKDIATLTLRLENITASTAPRQ